MSNVDEAAQIIAEAVGDTMLTDVAAKALADARLLIPDLPEPEDPGIFVPGGKGWLPCGPVGPSVWTAPNSLIMVQRVEPGDFTPAQARELALALLAAAQWAEQEQL